MIVTIASFKGGVGKTTTAVHLASYLSRDKKTLLVDGDPNRSATAWAARGSMPFETIDERQVAMRARDFDHIVIDTEARPTAQDLDTLIKSCDLLILPTTPDALALDAMLQTVDALNSLQARNYRILLTMVPPRPSRDGEEARAMLETADLPVFTTYIPRLVAFQKAALKGIPVHDVDDPRAGVAWEHYVAAGQEVLR